MPLWRDSAKHGLGAAKQGLGAAKHRIVKQIAEKTLQNAMDKIVFGPHRRERIAFLVFSCGKRPSVA